MTAALLNQELRDNLNAGFAVGTIHYFMQAATTIVTPINGFALEGNATTPVRATYSSLNSLMSGLSYPFGNGDGSTTFTLPDIQGRALHGMSASGHADVNALAASDGVAKASRTPETAAHTHTGPSHTHSFSDTATTGNASAAAIAGSAGGSATSTNHTHDVTVSGTTGSGGTGNTGSGGAHTGAYIVAGVWAVKY